MAICGKFTCSCQGADHPAKFGFFSGTIYAVVIYELLSLKQNEVKNELEILEKNGQ
jgi:hypothetical protein